MNRPWWALRRRPTGRLPDLRAWALFSIGAFWGCRSDIVVPRSTVEVMEPIAARKAASKRPAEASSELFVEETPARAAGDLAPPVYPPEAVKAQTGETVVYITITIDPKGAVTDLVPSWGASISRAATRRNSSPPSAHA